MKNKNYGDEMGDRVAARRDVCDVKQGKTVNGVEKGDKGKIVGFVKYSWLQLSLAIVAFDNGKKMEILLGDLTPAK